jgi:hypothetical protein
LEWSAVRSAWLWLSASTSLVRAATQAIALPASIDGQGGRPPASALSGNDGAVLKFEADSRFDQLRRHLEQLLREGNELVRWQAAMSVVHRLGERVGDAGTDANERGFLDAELGRDLVGGAEADTSNVAG